MGKITYYSWQDTQHTQGLTIKSTVYNMFYEIGLND